MRDYLTVADVLGMHAILLQRYGGIGGIRDMGGLETTIFRPQSGYYKDIVEEACALMEILLINHPFLDGNKRTAFAACSVFLKINGHGINADSNTLYEAILRWLKLPAQDRFTCIVEEIRGMLF